MTSTQNLTGWEDLTGWDARAGGRDGPGRAGGQRAEVVEAVGRLSRRQREVVILRYWCDLSDTETARALDIRVGTVRSIASRARARLASMLGETT